MASIANFLTFGIQLLVPQPCYDEFFVNFNFLHVACLKVVISKVLGYGIIAGSLMVKIPQVLKIINAKSAEGISILSVLLELFGITSSFAYGFANAFPFSAYGETMFLLLQTWLVGYLVFYYGGNSAGGVAYTALLWGAVAFLLSPLVPMQILLFLQTTVVFAMGGARLIQAVTNYRNSSTGQLSIITVTLLFLGSFARIFTSMQETNDTILVISFCSSATFNFIIFAQVLYYWNSKQKSS